MSVKGTNALSHRSAFFLPFTPKVSQVIGGGKEKRLIFSLISDARKAGRDV